MNVKLEKELNLLLDRAQINVMQDQKEKLINLVLLLIKWNKTFNLTAIDNPKEILIKHVMDSLVINKYLEGKKIIDVGTGAGFPGLPLAIINQEKEFTLIDSIGKKINFIKAAVRILDLKNVKPILLRVENYKPEELFDIVISRAFASIDKFLLLTKHLVDNKGLFYALKGKKQEKEFEKISKSFIILREHDLEVPELDAERSLVILKNEQ